MSRMVRGAFVAVAWAALCACSGSGSSSSSSGSTGTSGSGACSHCATLDACCNALAAYSDGGGVDPSLCQPGNETWTQSCLDESGQFQADSDATCQQHESDYHAQYPNEPKCP